MPQILFFVGGFVIGYVIAAVTVWALYARIRPIARTFRRKAGIAPKAVITSPSKRAALAREIRGLTNGE